MEISKDLIAASSIPLVLSILNKEDNYGYAIIKKVKELSEYRMEWTEGMLYPVLHRLEKQGCIGSYWQDSKTGRKRKYYTIEKKGSEVLIQHQEQWKIVNTTLKKSWNKKSIIENIYQFVFNKYYEIFLCWRFGYVRTN